MIKTATTQKDLTLKHLFFSRGVHIILCPFKDISTFHSYSGKYISIIFLLFYSDTACYIPCSASCHFTEFINLSRLLFLSIHKEYLSSFYSHRVFCMEVPYLCIWSLVPGHLGYFQSLTNGYSGYFQTSLLLLLVLHQCTEIFILVPLWGCI